MEREIKFRAWDTFNKRMVYDPYYFRDNFDKGLSHEPEWQVPYQFAEQWQDVDDGIWRPCHIMQYTGLKDKNGKEVYSGDLYQVAGNKIYEVRWIDKMQVQSGGFETYGACFVLWISEELFFPFDEFAFAHGEVIGNIYEKL